MNPPCTERKRAKAAYPGSLAAVHCLIVHLYIGLFPPCGGLMFDRGQMEEIEQIRARLGSVPDPVALLVGLFASSPIAFQIYDVNGTSLLTNPAFRELFGSEPPPDYNIFRD